LYKREDLKVLIFRWYKTIILLGTVIIFTAGCRAPEILSPSGDITIDAGDSISFSAETYPNAIYKWTFDGGAEDLLGQNSTVRFDRAGVYNVCLTVVFEDLDSGIAALEVTVNDPSPVSYTLTLDDYTTTRDPADSKTLVWVVEKDGNVVMRRNAKDESEFTYFDNTSGDYRVWIERFYDGDYLIASNIVEYSVP
jgi:PKD repeat protein